MNVYESHASDPEVRARGIGCSDIATVMGYNKWTSPHDLWMEKRGMAAPFEGNLNTRRGQKMEPLAREEYELECGYDSECILPGGYIDRRDVYPWWHGHPDLIVALDGQKDFPTELKTAERGTFHLLVNSGLSYPYLVQLVGEMYLCNADYAELFLLNPDSYKRHIFKLHRDDATDKLWCDIVAACNIFWQHVVDGTPPEALPQPENLPVPTGGKVQQVMDELWLKAGADLAVAQEIEAQAKELTKHARHQIQQIMEANGWLIAEGPVAMPEGTRTLRYHQREVKGRTTIKAKDLIAFVEKLQARAIDGSDGKVAQIINYLINFDSALFKKTGASYPQGNAYWIKTRQEIGGGDAGKLIE